MTIEQRLEKLTECHEALAGTIELRAKEGQRLDRRIEHLLRIAETHERRISRLERN